MFMGEYRHTVDPKGRLIVPSKFRELLGAEFVVTRGLDGCLFVYPMESWEAYVEELKKLPLTDRNARLFTRFIIAGATTCELDKQGRILIPTTLREFANLKKDVLLAGMLDHIEIWDEDEWKKNGHFHSSGCIPEMHVRLRPVFRPHRFRPGEYAVRQWFPVAKPNSD